MIFPISSEKLNIQLNTLLNTSKGMHEVMCLSRSVLEDDFLAASKTAITRKSASAPLKLLLEHGFISGKSINFGKGRSDHDSHSIKAVTGHCSDYDFIHAPFEDVLNEKYSSVYCGYVLNVLPPKARALTLKMISSITSVNGSAYIAVRASTESSLKKIYNTGVKHEDGVKTSSGTFQKGYNPQELIEYVKTEFKYVNLIKSQSGFILVEGKHKINH